METHADLTAVLQESQRLGFLGVRPIDEVIEHSRAFVRGLRDLEPNSTVVDLGAGGGVPGLVIAHERPDLQVTLLDRRTKRTDFLARVVLRLGWYERVHVAAADVVDFSRGREASFDAAVARGFGPPSETLAYAAALIAGHGRIVISEPPDGDRWEPELLERLNVVRRHSADTTVAIFGRS